MYSNVNALAKYINLLTGILYQIYIGDSNNTNRVMRFSKIV